MLRRLLRAVDLPDRVLLPSTVPRVRAVREPPVQDRLGPPVVVHTERSKRRVVLDPLDRLTPDAAILEDLPEEDM